jgi:hypothetical protein
MSDQKDERFGDEAEDVEAHHKKGYEATDDPNASGDSASDDFEAHKKHGFEASDDPNASDDDSDDFEAHRKATI